MKHILVPIGSNENAANTLQYAIDFAAEMNAKVFVFRAYKAFSRAGTMKNIDEFVANETNLYLNSMVKSVEQKNVDIKIVAAKGSTVESIEALHKSLHIDLIVMGPKSNSIKDEMFLGSTSGSIVKFVDIPVLIVPENYKFSPFKNCLTAFKSGKLNREGVLTPLTEIREKFDTKVNVLLVKTPNHTDEDLVLDQQFEEVQHSFSTSENATTFQGVLEHFQSHQPDLLCVFKRKRGFFKKLWESNAILKSEFHCSVPLLVLRGKM